MIINVPLYGFNEVVEMNPIDVKLPKVVCNTSPVRTIYKCFTEKEYLAVTIFHHEQAFKVQALVHEQSGDNINQKSDLLGVIWVRTRMDSKEYQDIDFEFFIEEMKRINVLSYNILDGLTADLDEFRRGVE